MWPPYHNVVLIGRPIVRACNLFCYISPVIVGTPFKLALCIRTESVLFIVIRELRCTEIRLGILGRRKKNSRSRNSDHNTWRALAGKSSCGYSCPALDIWFLPLYRWSCSIDLGNSGEIGEVSFCRQRSPEI